MKLPTHDHRAAKGVPRGVSDEQGDREIRVGYIGGLNPLGSFTILRSLDWEEVKTSDWDLPKEG